MFYNQHLRLLRLAGLDTAHLAALAQLCAHTTNIARLTAVMIADEEVNYCATRSVRQMMNLLASEVDALVVEVTP